MTIFLDYNSKIYTWHCLFVFKVVIICHPKGQPRGKSIVCLFAKKERLWKSLQYDVSDGDRSWTEFEIVWEREKNRKRNGVKIEKVNRSYFNANFSAHLLNCQPAILPLRVQTIKLNFSAFDCFNTFESQFLFCLLHSL